MLTLSMKNPATGQLEDVPLSNIKLRFKHPETLEVALAVPLEDIHFGSQELLRHSAINYVFNPEQSPPMLLVKGQIIEGTLHVDAYPLTPQYVALLKQVRDLKSTAPSANVNLPADKCLDDAISLVIKIKEDTQRIPPRPVDPVQFARGFAAGMSMLAKMGFSLPSPSSTKKP